MNIVWLSWKDRGHPLTGGAERVSGEIMDRMAADGHTVRHITALYPGSETHESVCEGLDVYRSGNRYSVYGAARKTFNATSADWADVVIDEMNTLPFWASRFSKKATNILLAYQLAREVWFYQMAFPLSLVGYLYEPIMLKLLSRGRYSAVATESESSKRDMEKYGLSKITTFRVGISTHPLSSLTKKRSLSLILSLGAVRPMKRTLEAIKAFEIAHNQNDKLRMVIAGDIDSAYGRKIVKYVSLSEHKDSIDIKGRVTNEVRLQLMQDAALILVTSIKEGWGLIVTEANSQGTPAIVYDVDGLRDSVRANKTGIIVPNNDYSAMSDAINSLLSNAPLYDSLRHNAWEMSKEYTFDNSYEDFMKIIHKAQSV
ncbi:MAG: glycosyltransferase family 4 protein [Candidatus Saccharimonas sp.]